MELEDEFSQLEDFFGKENINIEYLTPKEMPNPEVSNLAKVFSKVQITHLPSGIIVQGIQYDTQLENAIYALKEIKKQLSRIKFN